MARKSERTRQRIIQAANRLFYRKGYNRTSFTDVVEAAGVPRGNIYYYFKTKDDILRATIDYRINVLTTMLEEWDRNFGTPGDRLKRFLQVLANSREALVEWGCPMGTLNTELGKDQQELQEESQRMFTLLREWLGRQFTELGYPEQADSLAVRLLSRGQGLTVMAHIFHDQNMVVQETWALCEWVEDLTRRVRENREKQVA